jgi:hypothetical protein
VYPLYGIRDLCYPKEGEMPKDTLGEGCVSRRGQFVKLTSLMAVFIVPVLPYPAGATMPTKSPGFAILDSMCGRVAAQILAF